MTATRDREMANFWERRAAEWLRLFRTCVRGSIVWRKAGLAHLRCMSDARRLREEAR